MVVIKAPKQIKTPSNLKIAVRYILNEAKTLVSETAESDLDFLSFGEIPKPLSYIFWSTTSNILS